MADIVPIPIPPIAPKPLTSQYPQFKPIFSPRQMLEYGVFGGAVFSQVSQRKQISPIILEGLSFSKYRSQEPQNTLNYYQKYYPRRFRPMSIPPVILRLHSGGWFHWYCNIYSGQKSEADSFRIAQWKSELLTISYYIRENVEAGETQLERWHNNDFEPLKIWRQYLLEYGWHPNVDPLPFVI